MGGLAMDTTIESLRGKFKQPKQGRYVILPNQTSTLACNEVTAYLRNQSSEKIARKFVKQYNNKEYLNGFQIRCQLEFDQNDIDNQVNDFKIPQSENDEEDDYQKLSQDVVYNPPQPPREESSSFVPTTSTMNENTTIVTLLDNETTFEFPEDFKEKQDWKYIRDLNTTETGQGDVYLLRKLSETRIDAALKIYKRADNKNKRMRSHREMKALRTMAERNMQMKSNTIHLFDTNIPDCVKEATKNTNKLWILVSVARGYSLNEYMKKFQSEGIGLREAIILCLKILHVVNSFHTCGIVHRDIKPDNIYIDLQDNDSLEKAHITIFDFGLAYIKESTIADEDTEFDDTEFDEIPNKRPINPYTTGLNETLGNIWYRVPQLLSQKSKGFTEMQKNQLRQQRRSPSVDTSSVCAFLYWFLTKEVAGEYYVKKEPPPHRKIMQSKKDYWDIVVRKAIDTSGSKCEKSRLQRYLMHVFDQGFAGPQDQWTMKELLQHLNIMYTWLDNGNVPSENSLNLSRISTSSSSSLLSSSFLNVAFQTAADLFKAAKIYSVKKFSSEKDEFYHWDIGREFHWIDEIAVNQRTNVDSLYCYNPPGKIGIMQIYSLAKIDEEHNIKLFVGSIIDGADIRLPIHILPSNQVTSAESQSIQPTYVQQEEQVKEIFADELSTLIDLFRRTRSH